MSIELTDATIDVGSGSSFLVYDLLEVGYRDLTVLGFGAARLDFVQRSAGDCLIISLSQPISS